MIEGGLLKGTCAAALLSLDITSIGPFMISQPLVSGTLFGYLFGDIQTGILVGGLVQLLWMDVSPVGVGIPFDTMAVTLLTIYWAKSPSALDASRLLIAMALAIPFGILFKGMDSLSRRLHIVVSRRLDRVSDPVLTTGLSAAIAGGVGFSFFRYFVFYLAFFVLGQKGFDWIYNELAVLPWLQPACQLTVALLPMAGMGHLLDLFVTEESLKKNGRSDWESFQKMDKSLFYFALLRTFFRSFFLQALWNYERLQNIGFAYSVSPLLHHLSEDAASFRTALRKQLAFFNTHPYFAPVVMGAVYRKLKTRVDQKQDLDDPTLDVLKNSMGSAFGAVGDHVIWGTWRPFCALVAMSVGALVAYPRGSWTLAGLWWVVGFLVLFNMIHIWLRWLGLWKAAKDGPGVVRWIESLHLQLWAIQVQRLGLLLLVVSVIVYLLHWKLPPVVSMIGVLLGTMVLKRWKLATGVIFYAMIGVSGILFALGVRLG